MTIRSFLRTSLKFVTGHGMPHPPCPAACVPAGLCVYAVGDVHGHSRALDRLLDRIGEDFAAVRTSGEDDGGITRALIVFLGDYVDRGPDSRGVLDRLCALAAGGGLPCRFLLGNHEAAMLDFLQNPAAAAEWLGYGGVETLGSYGIRASVGTTDPVRCRALRDDLLSRLPDEHLTFLKGLESLVLLGDYAFVHAGVRPGVPLDRQRTEDLLWMREPFLSSRRHHGKIVVHGHTVVDQPQFLPNRIAVDTGAYATGILTSLALHGTAQRTLNVS